jgi:DMSO/TMAO reductase YedYZ molybdopterin-dependent catalytic subunit
MPREIEGDWIWGWPDRKWPRLLEGKDSQGRVICGRTPILETEGLITPMDSYYVVAQRQMPKPVHPDDWVLSIGGDVERPIELTVEERRKLPGRTVRGITEWTGNDAEFFNCLRDSGKERS